MVINNMMKNFPITVSNIKNDYTMFGPNLSGTKAKKVRQNLDRVVMDYVDVPKDFQKVHTFVTLMENVMFLYGTSLLITLSYGIKFVMVEHIPTRRAKKLGKYFKKYVKIYSRSFMIVQTVFIDMEFDKTIDKLMENVIVNTSTAK